MFEPFAQLDNGMRRTAGGTGLGMAISRELARLLGGTLDFTSEPGHGTVFTLALPAETPALPEARPTAAPVLIVGPAVSPAPMEAPQQPTPEPAGADPGAADDSALLIIEDDERFAGILAELARERGLVPVVTATGQAAQAMVRSLRPRAITLDLGLPDIDGRVLLDWLRHHPTTRDTPIHIISVTEGAAAARGVVGILSKPAGEDDLAAAMARLDLLAEHAEVDLVLMDAMMPVMDGLTATAQLRQDPATAHLPVTGMFRDPGFWAAPRRQLRERPPPQGPIRCWVAGCATGQEAYSLSILLQESGLEDHLVSRPTSTSSP